MFQKKYFIVSFIFIVSSILSAQPYYYTSTYEPLPYGHHNTGNIYRINMYNPTEIESLMVDIYDLGSAIPDEYGNWLAYEESFQLTIMNLNNQTQKNIISQYSEGVIRCSYAEAVNRLIIQFLGNYPKPEKMVMVDPLTLNITDTVSSDILWDCNRNEDIILSNSGDIMYLLKTDTIQQKRFIASYSFSSKQIITSKYIEELSESQEDEFFFNFRRNGLSVIESLFLLPTPTSYYRIYFLDKDSLSIPVIRDDSQTWADGYVASEGDYLLLFNNLLNSDSLGFTYTGKIEIYDMKTGELEKIIQLPSGGEVMCFENYPNNVYYVKDIELPTRQVWVLNMDSIFNVFDLTSLNPSSAIVNSSSFTLTVNGHGFDTLSTVYFNDTAKTTTFVSDSVLTAEISATDISIVGSYPVWATDEWGTSDTLMFTIVPQTPYLSKISPSLALPYDVFAKKSSFNVMVIGNNFTTSSVAYFNGVAKTTTYISDSLITFQLSSGDVGTTEKTVSVWIQNSNQFSDTLLFNVLATLPNQITPILECVRENGANSYTAYFGYNNYNSEDVLIPFGTKNNISSQFSSITGSPVNIFLSGRQTNVFSIDFNGREIFWHLNGKSVSASSKSSPCP